MGSLTKLQRSFIVGSLLGDGYLRIVKGRKNALLEVNHSITQKEYVDWKFEMVKMICRSAPVARRGNGNRIAYRFTTRQNLELTELYEKFYKDGKKKIPAELALDSMMLAVWYMDDGSKCRDTDVYLNTQQFDSEDQKKCLSMLDRMGIEGSLNKDKKYWRVRIKKSSLPKFWSSITPYVIPSMQYKLVITP